MLGATVAGDAGPGFIRYPVFVPGLPADVYGSVVQKILA